MANSGLSIATVPPGIPGELYLAGAAVARGYWNRPGLTAERFVANPFGPPGARMYRSGDLARWRDNGELELGGRADDPAWMRRLRIELGKVEATLLRHDDVTEAVALIQGADGARKRLVSYVVPAPGTTPNPVALRGFLSQVRIRVYCSSKGSDGLFMLPALAIRAMPEHETICEMGLR